jgi:hypothetical protein
MAAFSNRVGGPLTEVKPFEFLVSKSLEEQRKRNS